jgi:hypothetical protein
MELDDRCGIAVLLGGPHNDSGPLGAAPQFSGSLEPMGCADGERLMCGDGVKKVHLRP